MSLAHRDTRMKKRRRNIMKNPKHLMSKHLVLHKDKINFNMLSIAKQLTSFLMVTNSNLVQGTSQTEAGNLVNNCSRDPQMATFWGSLPMEILSSLGPCFGADFQSKINRSTFRTYSWDGLGIVFWNCVLEENYRSIKIKNKRR